MCRKRETFRVQLGPSPRSHDPDLSIVQKQSAYPKKEETRRLPQKRLHLMAANFR